MSRAQSKPNADTWQERRQETLETRPRRSGWSVVLRGESLGTGLQHSRPRDRFTARGPLARRLRDELEGEFPQSKATPVHQASIWSWLGLQVARKVTVRPAPKRHPAGFWVHSGWGGSAGG